MTCMRPTTNLKQSNGLLHLIVSKDGANSSDVSEGTVGGRTQSIIGAGKQSIRNFLLRLMMCGFGGNLSKDEKK